MAATQSIMALQRDEIHLSGSDGVSWCKYQYFDIALVVLARWERSMND